MEREESSSMATTVRVVTFSSGMQVKISFVHDQNFWSFVPSRETESVNDLCFFFERIPKGRLSPEKYHNVSTYVTLESGEHAFNWYEKCRATMRLRIGTFIEYMFHETTIRNQGFDCGMHMEHTVQVNLWSFECDHISTLSEDCRTFLRSCWTRGARIGNSILSSEVASLFSEYFYSLFHGGFTENEEQIIELTDIDAVALNRTFDMSVLERKRVRQNGYTLDCEDILKILQYSDQFSFLKLYNDLQDVCKNSVQFLPALNYRNLKIAQKWAQFVRKHDILGCLVRKLCVIECLEQLKALGTNIISQELNFKIDERIMELTSLAENRPKYTVHHNGERIRIMRMKEFMKSTIADPEKPTYLFLSKPLFVIKSLCTTGVYAWRHPVFFFTNNCNVRENDVLGIVTGGLANCPLNLMFPSSASVPDDPETQLLLDQES